MIEPKDLVSGKVYSYIKEDNYNPTLLRNTINYHIKIGECKELSPDIPFVVFGRMPNFEKFYCLFKILHLENVGVWAVEFNPERDKFKEVVLDFENNSE